MNYKIDWQATYDAIINLPSDIYFSSMIFDKLAEEATKHNIVELFDDDTTFYIADEGVLDII